MAMTCVYGSGECDGCMRCQTERKNSILGTCEFCGQPVHTYDDRYEFPDDVILHEDCGLDYIQTHYYCKGDF